MNKKELIEKIKEIEITYDYDETYRNLYNACIDYMNETKDWDIEYLFEDFIDEELMAQLIKHKIDNEGLWSVVNLLSNIERYDSIYRIDAYGYGHDIDKDDLEMLKEEILENIEKDI